MHDENPNPENTASTGERIEIEYLDDDRTGDDAAHAPTEENGGEIAQPSPQTDVERLSAELENVREMYLRKLAEFDNFRKRTDREREEFQRTAAEGLIRELLPVVDNFERALVHGLESDPEAFREGVVMISRQLWELLQREGLEVVDPEGDRFDPELHEAVQRFEGTDHDAGRVVTVLAKGYTYNGRLLRPAMVGVAVDAVEAAAAKPAEPTNGEGGAVS
jgi:molecular chaperone GrpE